MKMRPLASLGRAVAACLFASLGAAAQEAPAPAPNRLVVQIEYFKGAPLAYQPVPGSAWYARFGRTPTTQPRAAADTVRAVDVASRLDGERVEIRVGVHVGAQYFDRMDEVGTYRAAVGETVTASDLEAVGVVPFVFRVLRVNDSSASAPTVVNKTQSIEAAVTEFRPSPLPRGKLTLRNLSSKRVRAVYITQVIGGRNRQETYAVEREGKFIMEPGGTFEKGFGATEGAASGADFTPVTVESVVVGAAVFEDYTYEGEPAPVARKRALDEGERLQLRRLVALLREAQAAPDADAPEAAGRFRAKLTAVGVEPPQSAVDAILNSYPDLKPAEREGVKRSIEVSMHRLRRELLDDLAGFEKSLRAAPSENGFKLWLRERQERYAAWLSRL